MPPVPSGRDQQLVHHVTLPSAHPHLPSTEQPPTRQAEISETETPTINLARNQTTATPRHATPRSNTKRFSMLGCPGNSSSSHRVHTARNLLLLLLLLRFAF
ncbi:unnamed protein product [Ceratitis capitata]|uniref:(Mediterranean fruit fly) hypothetical protein n=1 Tax=Ceratitis capitata TaxID=7213 RepID=A0A811V6C2_CERCA|nr:unnamed protein product [Ceratitis capitata]